MNVTTETLRTYVKNVLAKLGAHSRLEAAALASRLAPAGRDEPAGGYPVLATLTPREREILTHLTAGSEERRVGKGVDLGGRRIIKKKKKKNRNKKINENKQKKTHNKDKNV